MTEAEIRDVVEQVLAAVLPTAPVETVSVDLRPNHADEDAIFVTILFRPGVAGAAGRRTSEARFALIDALRQRGETRFPYLTYRYADDPPPFGDDIAAAE